MKINLGSFTKLNIPKTIIKNIYGAIIIIILIIFIWLIYFIYQNLYQTIINPKPIKSEEIMARQEKINIQLFEEVTKKLEEKRQPGKENISTLNNPF